MTDAEDLDCQSVVELVTDYLEGALDGRSRAQFEEHLAICEGCAVYVEQMRATLRLVGRVTPETLPEAAQRRLVEAFRGWRSGAPAVPPL